MNYFLRIYENDDFYHCFTQEIKQDLSKMIFWNIKVTNLATEIIKIINSMKSAHFLDRFRQVGLI